MITRAPRRTLRILRGLRGLGVLNYYDLLAQANLQNCSPMDSACVSNNVAKEAAVEDFWAAHQSTGVPDDTRLTFTPQTSAQVTEFYDPKNLNFGGNVVDTRGIMSISSPDLPAPSISYAPRPLPPVVAPVAPTRVTSGLPAPNAPGGPTVINSSGVMQPAFIGSAAAEAIGLPSLSSVPWWAWLGGAALILFAVKGGK